MRVQLIRNATLKMNYGGATILVDPYFASRHSLPSYTGRSPNPLVELPVTTNEILHGIQLVIVSHLHSDHFDSVAKEIVPKDLPLICQPGDEETIRKAGFLDVTPLAGKLSWRGIEIERRQGNHGTGTVLQKMGKVMGFSLSAEGEPSVYWTGDTIFYPPVEETIRKTSPDVIFTHSCGALWDDTLIVMDGAQTVLACETASAHSIVVATHMEALDHATVDRAALRSYANGRDVPAERLLIPADGETMEFAAPRKPQ
jgi:L-ascorbate metabolism protein UlaG (beta-lactamase superfamily)